MDFLTTSLWAILISTMRKVLVLSSEKVATTCDNAKSIPYDAKSIGFIERKNQAEKYGYLGGDPPPLDSSLKQILEFLTIKLEEK